MWLWSPQQFQHIWEDVYGACDPDTQETIYRRLDYLLEHGPNAREPISKPLGDGLFELRAKDVRLIFYFGPNKTIVFVHGLIKKRTDIPKGDLRLARKRKLWIENEQEAAHAINEPY